MKEQNHGWAYAMRLMGAGGGSRDAICGGTTVVAMQDEDFDDIELGEPILRKCYYCGKPTSRTKNSVPTCKGCDRK